MGCQYSAHRHPLIPERNSCTFGVSRCSMSTSNIRTRGKKCDLGDFTGVRKPGLIFWKPLSSWDFRARLSSVEKWETFSEPWFWVQTLMSEVSGEKAKLGSGCRKPTATQKATLYNNGEQKSVSGHGSWSGWATMAKGYIRFHSQPRIGIWCYSVRGFLFQCIELLYSKNSSVHIPPPDALRASAQAQSDGVINVLGYWIHWWNQTN